MALEAPDVEKAFAKLVGKAAHYTIHELNQLDEEIKAQLYGFLGLDVAR